MLVSRAIRTGSLPEFGNRVSLDVHVPNYPPNPWWLGQLKLHCHDWPSNLTTQPVGNPVELTGFMPGEWVTGRFVPTNPPS